MAESAEKLIAPCGMNCALCSGYLAYKNKILRKRGKIHYCASCRVRNKQCAFLKGHCQKIAKNEIKFCYQCEAAGEVRRSTPNGTRMNNSSEVSRAKADGETFPCGHLKKIDERYRKNYGMSMIANLKEIKSKGMEKFLANQKKKHGCPKCGGMVSVHNKKCFKCAKINSWKD